MTEEIVVTEDNILIIKERLEKLYEKFSFDESEQEILIGNSDIEIEFPSEQERITYSISDFLKYTENIDSIVKVDNSTVRSSRIVQTIIEINDYFLDFSSIISHVVENKDYSISLNYDPFLVGLIATGEGMFDNNYGITPCSLYKVVEIIYKDEISEVDASKERKLVKEFLFYLSHIFNTPITIGEFITLDRYNIDEDIDFEEETTNNRKVEVINIPSDNLLSYSNLMDMHVEAMSIGNMEIKFLYYYKIIEHCSPIVSKMKAYELLNRKLDLLPYNRDYKYLDSIFELTREHDISLRDSELVYNVLLECIDIIQLYEFLPSNVKKDLSKKYQYKNENIKYDLDKFKQNQIKQGISNLLYATRNSIVHAKSNYTLTGEECKTDDLEELNNFISKLCYCLIAWNNRQPEMFKLR